MSRRARALLVASLCALSFACGKPHDPEGTLERISGGTLRVGITENPPWTKLGPPHEGVEVKLVEELARDLDAEIEWFEGAAEPLVAALELGELDLVVGGFASDDPYAADVTFTHPYYTSQVVVAVPEGEDIPGDIAGMEVDVEDGTEEAGILRKTDAVVNAVEDVTESDGAVAIDDWLLDDLGLVDTGDTLTETDRVMAIRPGENAWLVTLENFLLARTDDVPELLDEVES